MNAVFFFFFFLPNSFISENPLVAKVQYGMKITFIFILILFIDSVNRVYRVQLELAAATENSKNTYVTRRRPRQRRVLAHSKPAS